MNGAEVLTRFTANTSGVDKAISSTTTGLGKLTTAFTLGNIAAQAISKTLGIMTTNLDGAISRYDTMNNFPRVMSNLGIGADEADASIKKLSEKLQGLPTSLDSAASAVQRLTAKNGNVGESTNMFLALNNAILAGGANAQTQASALEQISQAYSKGKPDMMEWRTMLTAMPAQLKQVGAAMGGLSVDELGKSLRDGDITMDEFMNTLMKLNTEGVNGFASLEEQAKGATGGVGTSIKNMKTAMTRGIASMIGKIDGALEPFGGLSGVISSIGKVAEQVFSKIGDFIAKAIPVIANVISFIDKYKAALIPIAGIVMGIVAALTVYKTIMTVINTIQAIQNALMLANPAVLIIAAIVAAITAVIAIVVLLYNKCEWFRNLVNTIFEFIKMVIQAVIDAIVGFVQSVISFIQPLIDFVKNCFILWLAIFTTFWGTIFDVVSGIAQWVWNTVLSPIVGFFQNVFSTIWGIISKVIDKIKNAFNTVKNAIITAFNAVKSTIQTIFNTIANIVKTPINGIINGINKVIDKINGLKVPDWVPGLGGKSPNFSRIPQLAVGTNYVPEDTLAMIHKGEAVVPKKFNPYAGGLDNSTIGNMLAGKQQIIVNVDASFETDPLGQVVRKIKTYSGGARNDYNYGMGGSRSA